MSHILKAQLKKVKQLEGRINPDRAWVEKTRISLLQRISISSSVSSSLKSVDSRPLQGMIQNLQALFPQNMFYQAKPLLVSVLVFALAGSGWIASASASESLPGDTLWQVKLASEKTQIVLANITGNDEKNMELQLKFASRRVAEIKTVASEDKFNAEEKVKRAGEGLKQLQESISSVDSAVQSEDQKDSIGKNAKQVNDTTNQISTTLKELAGTVDGVATDVSLTKQVAAVQQAVEEVGINVVKVAVEGAQNDEQRQAAQELVEEKIVSALSEADGALHQTAEVKALIEKVDVNMSAKDGSVTMSSSTSIALEKEHVSSTTSVVSSSTMLENATSTNGNDLLPPALTLKQTITSILEEAGKSSDAVQKQIDDIKLLLANNDLTGALEKAKQLIRATSESTQKTIDIKKTVQQVTTITQESNISLPPSGSSTIGSPLSVTSTSVVSTTKKIE
ncbi:MAG: hypothetical protein COU32_01025 [Candidatus Magasanikbacteria bacterium CG10_big_fil_rev_8_21_14_0_10_42_10]|uniref:DUF5667 domain-containing protein n=2 Tax=Candidatus Magasanikiibacteriota TaxID=1752731 RepID=A0A2H0TWW1_9BACT|nr:MAG: hypothetical protein COU32_01025 [Candidatus Magasanikbacteria bacterium CG10_big_fil_rev_8_21_14_0_10_42_10]PIZ94062.1 MAG: hypothetical protein COX82_01415 [Candidatus Magasanikbacteria bacterium CG_4_10_14_0_2_um_filter_41_10]